MYGLQLSLSLSRFPRSQRGFTLVELAIVLVIIGLLIGGLLVAQSMISGAKISSQAAQIQQFDAAVMAFKSKYNYLPGDAPAFGGDGDGVITTGTGNSWSVNIFTKEIANFWNNLMPDKFASCTGGCIDWGQKTIGTGTTKNVPLAKIGKSGSMIVATAISLAYVSGTDPRADTSNPRNGYIIVDPSNGSVPVGGAYYNIDPTTSSNSPLAPIELIALDTKIDDGDANAGNVMAGKMTACGGNSGGCFNPTSLAGCSSGAKYGTSSNNLCTPFIRIGGVAGELQ